MSPGNFYCNSCGKPTLWQLVNAGTLDAGLPSPQMCPHPSDPLSFSKWNIWPHQAMQRHAASVCFSINIPTGLRCSWEGAGRAGPERAWPCPAGPRRLIDCSQTVTTPFTPSHRSILGSAHVQQAKKKPWSCCFCPFILNRGWTEFESLVVAELPTPLPADWLLT